MNVLGLLQPSWELANKTLKANQEEYSDALEV